MPDKEKVEGSSLEPGYEFSPSSYMLDASTVAAYLKAVEDTSYSYQGDRLVPPMAVAAHALAALSKSVSLPPGTIHVSQEIEFRDTVSMDESLVSLARVNRNQKRGKLQLLTIDLNVFNQNQKLVMTGKASFILPEPGDGR